MTAGADTIVESLGADEPTLHEPGFVKRLTRRPVAVASLAFLAIVVLAAVLAPVVAPYEPNSLDLVNVLQGPSWAHPLGTDNLGRDILSRIIFGGRVTLVGTAIGVGVALAVGVSAGVVAGYAGGRSDWVVTRLGDMALAIPAIMILLVVLSVFGRDETIAMVSFGLIISPVVMRVIRGATLAVRDELFVDAARVSGLTSAQVIGRHILPRISGVVIVQASLLAASAVLVETGLGFLGLGVPPPTATWGGLVATASTYVQVQPWLLVPSGLIVALTVLAFGLLGDAVRDTATESWLGSPAQRTVRSSRRTELHAPAPRVRGTSEDHLLSVEDLVVVFPGRRRVVDGVSFELKAGETLGLVGESGCGKTVTALALLRLLPGGGYVESGHCWMVGRDLIELSDEDARRVRGSEIGLVSQNAIASLDPVFTVGSQLSELVRLHQPRASRVEVRQRVLELLEMVRLHDPSRLVHRYPHELSGGMAQRVAIAAALVGEPRLLIADEPTTALDVTVQAEILTLLRSLQRQTGMAILLITHDWGIVADMCERAVVMYAGQVVEVAAVDDLFQQPLHPYTEGLLQSNPRLGRARQHLAAIPGSVPPPESWPAGCRFHPRCKYATADCQLSRIPLLEDPSGRLSRCIHSDRLRERALAV